MPAPRYTCRGRRGEPAGPPQRLLVWRKAIEELPQGLADRLREGQPEARAEFFRRYAPQARRILFLQGFCEEVDDAVQEVFIKVYRAQIPAEPMFLAWFYRVILNTGRDQGRRRKTRRGLLDKLQQIATDPYAAAPAEPAEPALLEALSTLPTDLRECVALRFFADLPLEEIAVAQGVPVGTVKSRLHGAMKRLRGALESSGFEYHG
jgi:RNA polymerase sigma factor (sigma-70 family)